MMMKLRTHMRTFLYLILTTLIPSATVSLAHEDQPGIEVELLAKNTVSWDGDELPAYPTGTPEVSILRITIPAHTALPLHRHPVINAGVLLEGQLTVVTPDGLEKHMKAGDSLIELVEKWHFGRNDGDEPAVILVVYAGEVGKPITVKATEAEKEALMMQQATVPQN